MAAPKYNVEVRTGDVLAGKYRVERILAAGGMGVVVEATHVGLNDRVAIKFLRFPQLADDDMVSRFLREAQSAARIKSPHVARVVDVGTLDSGSPYIVMELLEGGDLQKKIDDGDGVTIEQAARYALQTCEALAAAHARGIIHRDIKPGNLFLAEGPDREPIIKVLDFGISKVVHEAAGSDYRVTETQRSMGSPSYMSPEQMRSARKVDERTDIWSLGVVIYELLTGVVPFSAQTPPELYAMVLDADVRHEPAVSLRAGLPAALDAVLDRCLAKDANLRFANVAELAWALAPFAGELGTRSASRCSRILGLTESARIAPDSGPISPQIEIHDGTMPSVRSQAITPLGLGPGALSPLASTSPAPLVKRGSSPRPEGLDTSVAFGHTGWGPFGPSKWKRIAVATLALGAMAGVGFAVRASLHDASSLISNEPPAALAKPVDVVREISGGHGNAEPPPSAQPPAIGAPGALSAAPVVGAAPALGRAATGSPSSAGPSPAPSAAVHSALTKGAPKPGKPPGGSPAGSADESVLLNRK